MRFPLPSPRVLGGALFVLAVALAWQLGQRRGLERGEASVRAVLERVAAAEEEAIPEIDERTNALAALAGERTMLKETVRVLRAELEAADRLSAADRAELELYRRIGADGAARDLAIDTLGRRGDDPATLYLTLVQARGRGRIAGTVEVVPLGSDVAELPPRAPDDPRAALADGPAARWSVPFDLRFFETLEITLDEAVPPVIEIRVVPARKPHTPFRQRFRREDIRILD